MSGDVQQSFTIRHEAPMSLFSQIFTWWNGQTLGTRFATWKNGEPVGEDEQGNRFYRSRDGKRRWVIFNGEAEASRVSPDWHGWLHHTFDDLPSKNPLPKKNWEKPHHPNLTGTAVAYRPDGSLSRSAPVSRNDYEAWTPE